MIALLYVSWILIGFGWLWFLVIKKVPIHNALQTLFILVMWPLSVLGYLLRNKYGSPSNDNDIDRDFTEDYQDENKES